MERIRGIAIKTLTILAGFWLADLAAARIQAGIAAGESIKRIMDGMTTMLQHPTALGFDRTSLLCGLGGACAVGLYHLYRWSMSQRNWGLRVKMCVWLGVSRGLDLAFLNAD